MSASYDPDKENITDYASRYELTKRNYTLSPTQDKKRSTFLGDYYSFLTIPGEGTTLLRGPKWIEIVEDESSDNFVDRHDMLVKMLMSKLYMDILLSDIGQNFEFEQKRLKNPRLFTIMAIASLEYASLPTMKVVLRSILDQPYEGDEMHRRIEGDKLEYQDLINQLNKLELPRRIVKRHVEDNRELHSIWVSSNKEYLIRYTKLLSIYEGRKISPLSLDLPNEVEEEEEDDDDDDDDDEEDEVEYDTEDEKNWKKAQMYERMLKLTGMPRDAPYVSHDELLARQEEHFRLMNTGFEIENIKTKQQLDEWYKKKLAEITNTSIETGEVRIIPDITLKIMDMQIETHKKIQQCTDEKKKELPDTTKGESQKFTAFKENDDEFNLDSKFSKLDLTDRADKKNRSSKIPIEEIPYCYLKAPTEVLVWAHKVKGYEWGNWRKGHYWMEVIGALLRHVQLFKDGEDNDPESGLSHLHHASCNLMFLIHDIDKYGDLLDNRPKTKSIFETETEPE